ncbi:proteasomal ubiquitin receptor ADRM1 isoform X1 [Bos indicus x Bos taurus]|uniref:proteasomal ubiquitin receptor ADRM1 isoform X1 n=1 Tax=Bos indicus x Bos taurus TaxID=30522 RepID=UPI000F7D540C|nr:proteasomal ubiquitin receptor ADRM1 isoform X1 [Bos indicus x Bos taurus]
MQEPKTDQDEEHCRKVNEYLNNPPMPGALGASGSGGHELSALGGNGHLPGCAVRLESVSADVDPGWCGPVAKRRWRIQVRSPLGRFRSWSLLLSSVGDPSVSPIALAPGRRHSAHSSGSAEMGAAPRTLVAAEGWGQTQLEAPGHRSPNLSTFCPAGEGGLQSLLGNMSHSQLMQLIGPAGLGGLGGLGALTGPGLASLLGSGGPPASSSSSSSRSQSAAVTPSSTTSSTRATPAPSAPAAASATSPSPAPSSGDGASTAASPAQPIQLSDLQSILATMSVPAGPGGGQQVDLASVLTPEIMAPILANADVQERLLPYLPSGESLPQTAEEIQNTLTSPQFQQALGMFSAALASGQLGPLMCQFGLPAEAVEAANKGDVEAFAKAMQNSASPEQQEGDGKDKKDEEEDMSLD